MTGGRRVGRIAIGFEERSARISLAAITPLRVVSTTTRRSAKYAQIAASIAEVGIVEPPVVVRDANDPDR
jgi:ParB-like chromosome segregation protein Spo0J